MSTVTTAIESWRRALRPTWSRLLTRGVANVMSIGIFSGQSPLALSPAAGARNPVLTPQSVTDAVSTLVGDPFMIRVDSTWYMFFEAVVWRGSRRAVIAYATSRDGRSWQYQRIVLAEPFNLSYPQVFRIGSDFFMIPEAHATGSVRLYRADPFPTRWVFEKALVGGAPFVDASVFQRDGRWWMYVSHARGHDTLRLFSARDVGSAWVEHRRSPLIRGDAHKARPAGRVISTGGRTIRFAQDCSTVYGQRVRAFEVTRLTDDDYDEAEACPGPVLEGSGVGWNRSGMHHVDAHELGDGSWLACVDGWFAVGGTRRVLDAVRTALRPRSRSGLDGP